MSNADLTALQEWARSIMDAREPDFVIGAGYLRRWWVVPRNPFCNVYLHEFTGSDDDRAMHDHPWDNRSLIIEGGYYEHTPDGVFWRAAGEVHSRTGESMHRIEMPPGKRAVTLFQTGPVVREWGFDCPQGWRHWKEFVDARDNGQVGPGCGEAA